MLNEFRTTLTAIHQRQIEDPEIQLFGLLKFSIQKYSNASGRPCGTRAHLEGYQER